LQGQDLILICLINDIIKSEEPNLFDVINEIELSSKNNVFTKVSVLDRKHTPGLQALDRNRVLIEY